MDYRKERNFIVAYDGDKCRGKWNILTNEYVGIKGAVVKSKPTAFTPSSIRTGATTPMLAILRIVGNQSGTWYPFTPDHGKRLEEIASVGLIVRDDYYTWRNLTTDKIALTKDCVKYLTDNFGGIYSHQSIDNYRIYKDHRSFLSKLTEKVDWATDVINEIRDDVEKEFLESSLFVLSSRYEGFGMVIVEAMACGLPVISFDCPCGPRAIITNGKDGLLVDNGNVTALAQKIITLISDVDRCKDLAVAASNTAQRFTMSRIASEWVKLFEDLR